MVLQFFLAFQAVDSYGGLIWITDQRKVARNYLYNWFVFDAATIFVPAYFDWSIAFARPDESGVYQGFVGDIGILRTLRIIRLAKLIRLLRASRLYARWQSKISASTSLQTIVTCSTCLFLGAHW